MKKLFGILSVILFALILVVPAAAQSSSVAGEWDVILNTPGGPRNLKALFKVEGEKLTGELRRENAPAPAPLQGTVKGKEVKFSYTVRYNDNDLLITMIGNVEGDAIKGTADFGGVAQDEWSAKRASGAAAASAAPAASSSGEKVDVTGSWNVTVETEAGSGNPSFTFKQEGEKLSGRYKGLLGEFDVTGTVKGDKIEFSFKATGQVEGTVTYSGTTDGKTMKGKLSLAGLGEGTFTGKKQ
jgi:hypothetical protein